MVRHTWTESDDLVALYLYKYGDGKAATVQAIAASRGISAASLRMRIGNFKALDSGKGLQNWARQSEMVFTKYGDVSESQLTELIGE